MSHAPERKCFLAVESYQHERKQVVLKDMSESCTSFQLSAARQRDEGKQVFGDDSIYEHVALACIVALAEREKVDPIIASVSPLTAIRLVLRSFQKA